MSVSPGNPINPNSLVDLVKTKYQTILSKLTTLIPLGFNSEYTIVGTKIFNIRPKVINPYYSSRSGSDINNLTADTTQPNIGVAFLGTPWTHQLSKDFGLDNYAISSLGDTSQPFIKLQPTLKINPVSDLVGGIPYLGNSPFINRGHLAFSNSFEDANIRGYTTPSGDNLVVKAQSLGLAYTYVDSFGLEDKISNGYGTGIKYSNPLYNFSGTVVGTNLTAGDYVVMVTGTSTRNKSIVGSSIFLVPTSDLYYSYGANSYNLIPTHGIGATNIVYERPLFSVYSNGTSLEVSSQTAWNETISTGLNTPHQYGKVYQQATSENTAQLVSSRTDDRRLIPTYYYYNLNNSTYVDLVGYQGLIKDAPGAGANQVYLTTQTIGGSSVVKGVIEQCEITNGTNSIWVKNINVEDILNIQGTGYNTTGTGSYIWLVGDVIERSTPTGSTYSQSDKGNILHLAIYRDQFSKWSQVQKQSGNILSVSNRILKEDTYRCRLGWIPRDGSDSQVITINNEKHYYPNINRFSTTLNELTLGTGQTTSGLYNKVTYNTCKVLPFVGTNLPITSLDLEMWNISGTSVTGTTWVAATTNTIATAVNTDISLVQAIGTKGNAAFLGSPGSGTSNYIFSSNHTLPIGTNDSLYYAGTGADGGSYWNKSFKMALVKGFTLPYSFE